MGQAARRLLVTALLLLLSGSSLAASAQCELKPGVKLGADKVGDKNGTSSATAAACCTLCQANTKCIVFAWDKDKHICDIFDKMGDSKAKANYVSGLAHAAPPGPPVPPTPPSPPSPGGAFACDGKHCVAKAGGPYNNSKCDKKCKKGPKPPPPPPPPPPPASTPRALATARATPSCTSPPTATHCGQCGWARGLLPGGPRNTGVFWPLAPCAPTHSRTEAPQKADRLCGTLRTRGRPGRPRTA